MIDYKKMTNDEKREIFNNCCLGILRDEDYTLVKDFMCSNLRYYKEFYEEWRDAGYRVEKVRITPILIKLMNMVIKDNDYVIVEKLPELLLKYHVLTERHIDFMNLLMDPASVYRKNKAKNVVIKAPCIAFLLSSFFLSAFFDFLLIRPYSPLKNTKLRYI